MPRGIQSDGAVLNFQAGVEGDWRRGLFCILSVPEGGLGDWYMNFSGRECDFRIFRPILAFRQEIVAGNGIFLMMT